MPDTASYIRWFREIGLHDVALVGGKNASLGELYRELTGVGVHVPNGFAITAEGYRYFMQARSGPCRRTWSASSNDCVMPRKISNAKSMNDKSGGNTRCIADACGLTRNCETRIGI